MRMRTGSRRMGLTVLLVLVQGVAVQAEAAAAS